MTERAALLAAMNGRKIAVLGDLIADCYVEAYPERLSREAPVLILKYEGHRFKWRGRHLRTSEEKWGRPVATRRSIAMKQVTGKDVSDFTNRLPTGPTCCATQRPP